MNEKEELSSLLLEWSTTLLRLSLHDFHHVTRSQGLSLAQMFALMHLHYRGASEVTHFCEMMQISPAGASQMIERLVQQGVVQRDEIPGDRRVRLVQLTERGRQAVLESIASRRDWVEQIVADLSPEERRQIKSALNLLNERAAELDVRP